MDAVKTLVSNHTTIAKSIVGSAAVATTGAATGAVGAAAGLLGFGAGGVGAGTAAASAMSASWISGIGMGAVSSLQSAGALFMTAVGGSTAVAAAAVAVPVVAGAGAIYAFNYFTRSNSKDEVTSNGEPLVVSTNAIPPSSDIASMYTAAETNAHAAQTDCFECSEDEDD